MKENWIEKVYTLPESKGLVYPGGEINQLINLGKCLASEPIGDCKEIPILVNRYNRLNSQNMRELRLEPLHSYRARQDNYPYLRMFTTEIQHDSSGFHKLMQIRLKDFDDPNYDVFDGTWLRMVYLIDRLTGQSYAADEWSRDNFEHLFKEASKLSR